MHKKIVSQSFTHKRFTVTPASTVWHRIVPPLLSWHHLKWRSGIPLSYVKAHSSSEPYFLPSSTTVSDNEFHQRRILAGKACPLALSHRRCLQVSVITLVKLFWQPVSVGLWWTSLLLGYPLGVWSPLLTACTPCWRCKVYRDKQVSRDSYCFGVRLNSQLNVCPYSGLANKTGCPPHEEAVLGLRIALELLSRSRLSTAFQGCILHLAACCSSSDTIDIRFNYLVIHSRKFPSSVYPLPWCPPLRILLHLPAPTGDRWWGTADVVCQVLPAVPTRLGPFLSFSKPRTLGRCIPLA